MTRPSQLTQLLWDFYRENPEELQQLKILQQCQVFRFWGSFCIRVQTPTMAQRIHDIVPILEAPIQSSATGKTGQNFGGSSFSGELSGWRGLPGFSRA